MQVLCEETQDQELGLFLGTDVTNLSWVLGSSGVQRERAGDVKTSPGKPDQRPGQFTKSFLSTSHLEAL